MLEDKSLTLEDKMQFFGIDEVDWYRIGVHPTPEPMAFEFGKYVSSCIKNSKSRWPAKSEVSLLDACSGDGRLGHAVAEKLVALGYTVTVTFLEVDSITAALIEKKSLKYKIIVIKANFFTFNFSTKFDLVVSNPPYQAISRMVAKKFGFEWNEAKNGGQNLYGLSIKRCIEVCASKGFVAVIAPHGWLRNHVAATLREFVAKSCTALRVNALSNRTLFPDVVQDTSFHFILVDKLSASKKKKIELNVKLQFDGGKLEKIPLIKQLTSSIDAKTEFRVRVGPFVWNREKQYLRDHSEGMLTVINGANIQKNGLLNLDDIRLKDRQYVTQVDLPINYISKAPFIVVKRTMRGKPGEWHVDVALINKRNFQCVVENHVVVIETLSLRAKKNLHLIKEKLAEQIELLHRFHGHPNISAHLTRVAVESLFEEFK